MGADWRLSGNHPRRLKTMPTFTTTKNYSSGAVLTKAQLDAMIDGVATFLNTTKLDGDNLATGGVPTAALADVSVTAAKLAADAVTTAKILDDAVTSAKLDTNIAIAGTLSCDGNMTVGNATTDTLTLGGSSGIVFTNVTTASKTGVSIDSTDDNFYPGGTSKASIKAVGTKTMGVYDPTADRNLPIITSIDPGSSGSLVIVSGRMNGSYAVDLGTGWTVNRVSAGVYDVTFSTAFSATPVVVVTTDNNLRTAIVGNEATTGFRVVRCDNSAVEDGKFTFFAIGAR